jgi:hypothetical protein
MKKDLKNIANNDPLFMMTASNAHILIIFLLLCDERTNTIAGLSQFNPALARRVIILRSLLRSFNFISYPDSLLRGG